MCGRPAICKISLVGAKVLELAIPCLASVGRAGDEHKSSSTKSQQKFDFFCSDIMPYLLHQDTRQNQVAKPELRSYI